MDQQALKEYFLNPALEGKTYLLIGVNDPESLLPVAKEDLLIYRPQGKACLHPVENMRDLKKEALRSPHSQGKKLIIVHDAEKMYPASSNALLKIFEEPPKHTFIFLLTHRPDQLLPTILSRSTTITCKQTLLTDYDPEYTALLNNLPYPTYFDLKKAIEPITKKITALKEQEDENALPYYQETHRLLQTLLYYYRDMEALSINPYTKNLLLPQEKSSIDTALQQGKKVPLKKVSDLITQTETDIQKGGSLQNCLESLLIQIL